MRNDQAESNPRVAILVPETGTVSADWAMQLLRIKTENRKIFTSRGEPIDVTRNKLVEIALDEEAEWLFFLDSDIIHLRRADGQDLDYILHVSRRGGAWS